MLTNLRRRNPLKGRKTLIQLNLRYSNSLTDPGRRLPSAPELALISTLHLDKGGTEVLLTNHKLMSIASHFNNTNLLDPKTRVKTSAGSHLVVNHARFQAHRITLIKLQYRTGVAARLSLHRTFLEISRCLNQTTTLKIFSNNFLSTNKITKY